MAGSIANVMLTQNDEVDSLSDLTQICLEIKSQVSAIYRFICPKRPNCLKNLKKIFSRCLIIALCESDFKFFMPFYAIFRTKIFFVNWGPNSFKNSRAAGPTIRTNTQLKK